MEFYKYHGTGNDFIMVDNMAGKIRFSNKQIKELCNRHKGIGADGVILVENSDVSDCFMNYYNADGSLAEMCGNGVRCVVKFLEDNLLIKKKNFKIETRAGIKEIKKEKNNNYSVNMGKPVFSHKDFPAGSIQIENLKLYFAGMGNPHAVAFVDKIEKYNLRDIGPKIENHKKFPNKINFELVEDLGKNKLRVKVWERGSGATLACGTGACAVYAVYEKYKNKKGKVTIELPGGNLFMSRNEKSEIIMRGPAVCVFKGELEKV